jgi:L-fuculose-phosphate aldolase
VSDRPGAAGGRRAIVRVCRRLWERGLIAGQDGNVSLRIGTDHILVTPAGLSKGELRVGDIVEMTLDGVAVGRRAGQASSEMQIHLAAYAARPDVEAVVHAHPPTATGFAVAGELLEYEALAELVYNVGQVPLVPYAMPGTRKLADLVGRFAKDHDVMLLANHGAVAVGPTLLVAHQRMESLEHAARILLAARQLGGVTRLPAAEVRALEDRRRAATTGMGTAGRARRAPRRAR